jgi:uncharacterized membrane protein YqjE
MKPVGIAIARALSSPETTIPDLVRRLGDDSKHLLSDEVRLAKLEMHEAAHEAGAAAKFFAVALAAGALAAVALTVLIATAIGRAVNGHMWAGTLIAGVVDLILGAVLVKLGIGAYAESPRALGELRDAQR